MSIQGLRVFYDRFLLLSYNDGDQEVFRFLTRKENIILRTFLPILNFMFRQPLGFLTYVAGS